MWIKRTKILTSANAGMPGRGKLPTGLQSATDVRLSWRVPTAVTAWRSLVGSPPNERHAVTAVGTRHDSLTSVALCNPVGNFPLPGIPAFAEVKIFVLFIHILPINWLALVAGVPLYVRHTQFVG